MMAPTIYAVIWLRVALNTITMTLTLTTCTSLTTTTYQTLHRKTIAVGVCLQTWNMHCTGQG